jgi:hypothetical protein
MLKQTYYLQTYITTDIKPNRICCAISEIHKIWKIEKTQLPG